MKSVQNNYTNTATEIEISINKHKKFSLIQIYCIFDYLKEISK